MLGLRLGDKPQAVVTTTPRPTKLIKRLLADPTTIVTRGSTFDNVALISREAFVERIAAALRGPRASGGRSSSPRSSRRRRARYGRAR